MNTPILYRFEVLVRKDLPTNRFEYLVWDTETMEVYSKGFSSSHAEAMWVGLSQRTMIEKEWPDCQDQTLNTELKFRKTITSSCGRLKVTESL